MGLEIQQRKANQEEYSKERSHLERIVELVQAKIAALMEQKSKEEEGLSQQLSDVEKIRALLERGLASSSRIAEEQRALLYARTRVSETTAQVSLARRELDEAKRKLQNLDERRRISFTSELQDAVISMEKLNWGSLESRFIVGVAPNRLATLSMRIVKFFQEMLSKSHCHRPLRALTLYLSVT
jgi:hypothetical protein